ncbi:2953_t:CDS:2 [Entrophospora sp. SA101]|nr:2953_t:CDS:2 [Entrophospora sp. SA101]
MLSFKDNKLTSLGMHFNVWDWSIPELYGIVLGMMVKLDLSECLQIRNSEMLDFIIDVEKGYHDTEYHSFYHAVDVVAVLYYMLTDLGAAKYLTPLDSICLMIAGLCHDIGHPGLNNVYQVNAKTPLAIKYNNQSVLENYSCALTMELLTKHKLFRNLHSCNIEFLENDFGY